MMHRTCAPAILAIFLALSVSPAATVQDRYAAVRERIIKSRDYAGAFALAKSIGGDNWRYSTDATMLAAYAGYLACMAGDRSILTWEVKLDAQSAAILLEAGHEPGDWAPFKDHDTALAWMYYIHGYFDFLDFPVVAAGDFVKVCELPSGVRDGASTWGNLALTLEAGPYAQVLVRYKAKIGTSEEPVLRARAEALRALIAEVAAKAVAIGERDQGLKVSLAAWRAVLEKYYKRLHGGSLDGLEAYVAGARGRTIKFDAYYAYNYGAPKDASPPAHPASSPEAGSNVSVKQNGNVPGSAGGGPGSGNGTGASSTPAAAQDRYAAVRERIIKSRDYAGAFTLAKSIVGDYWLNSTDAAMLAADAGYLAILGGDKSISTADVERSAHSAAFLLEEGDQADDWAPFKDHDTALAWMYYIHGYFNVLYWPVVAADDFVKACELPSDLRDGASTWGNLARTLDAGPYAQVLKGYKAKIGTPAEPVLRARAEALRDLIAEVAAKAVALGERDQGLKVSLAAWRAVLENYYKGAHGGSLDGLEAYVAGARGRTINFDAYYGYKVYMDEGTSSRAVGFENFAIVIAMAIDQRDEKPLKQIAGRGAGAVPGLVDALDSMNDQVRAVAAELLAEVAPKLPPGDPLVKAVATDLLARLIKGTEHTGFDPAAVLALCRLGPIIETGSNPKDLTSAILFDAVEPSPEVTRRLSQFAIPEFVSHLEDDGGLMEEGEGFAHNAVLWLRAMGPAATPALLKTLSSTSFSLGYPQERAALALGGTGDPEAIKALKAVLAGKNNPGSVRACAAAALESTLFGEGAAEGAADLVARELRASAKGTLSAVLCDAVTMLPPEDAAPSVAVLKEWAAGSDPWLKPHATEALARLRKY